VDAQQCSARSGASIADDVALRQSIESRGGTKASYSESLRRATLHSTRQSARAQATDQVFSASANTSHRIISG
jgi:hypothetical protein